MKLIRKSILTSIFICLNIVIFSYMVFGHEEGFIVNCCYERGEFWCEYVPCKGWTCTEDEYCASIEIDDDFQLGECPGGGHDIDAMCHHESPPYWYQVIDCSEIGSK